MAQKNLISARENIDETKINFNLNAFQPFHIMVVELIALYCHAVGQKGVIKVLKILSMKWICVREKATDEFFLSGSFWKVFFFFRYLWETLLILQEETLP